MSLPRLAHAMPHRYPSVAPTNTKRDPQAMTTLTLKTAPSCRACGESIRWERTTAGFVPMSLDDGKARPPGDCAALGGKDHREVCPGVSRAYRIRVRDKNHEVAVAALLELSHGLSTPP